MTLTEKIKQKARELGFQKVGIAPAEPLPEGGNFLLWLARGYHGQMGWMERTATKRIDPRKVLPGAKSIVSVAMNYYTGNAPCEDELTGKISCYALGKDYHLVLQERLQKLYEHILELDGSIKAKLYVDTGPILEKAYAQRAGVGWIGKHTNLITQEYGSWVFLGEIILDRELDYDEPAFDRCGSCTRCIEACPTQAIVEPYVLDARRCISYLTIELRGYIPEEFRSKIGNLIYGCDICQDVCPWNRFARPSRERDFYPTAATARPKLKDLLKLSLEAFRAAFRHSAIKRAKWQGLLRNVAVALGNARDRQALSELAEALRNPDPIVRAHAAWAIGQIGGQRARQILARSLDTESDQQVRQEIELALAKTKVGGDRWGQP